MDWINLAHHKDKYRAVVNTVMNPHAPKMVQTAMTIGENFSFSTRIDIHRVSQAGRQLAI
jgi:hypothetical protein